MQFDLETSYGREALATKIKDDIATASIELLKEPGHRSHLGASVLGHQCEQYLWLTFRWAWTEQFTERETESALVHEGRMLRLWNRGHLEETRIITWLKKAGWRVTDIDKATGKQIRMSFAEGHGGGSLDSELEHDMFPTVLFLGEYKTHNTKSFGKLVYDGLEMSKRQHWGQMCIYGRKRNIRFGIYIAVNKNDDAIEVFVVELDWGLADMLLAKGEAIILSQQPREKLSDNPAYFECKWCSFFPICHEGAKVEKNCRSCRHAQPVAGGKWHCNEPTINAQIPDDFIPKGCGLHFGIVN